MTIEFKSRAINVVSSAPRGGAVSGRRFASVMTAGAAVMALLLAMAMPARAGNDDLAKALIAALVIGAIVHEVKDDDKDHGAPERARHQRVPAVCAISIQGDNRDVTLYAESCLRREGLDRRLPRGCANTARIFGQRDRVYSAKCLRDAGFRLSDR